MTEQINMNVGAMTTEKSEGETAKSCFSLVKIKIMEEC